MGFKRLSIIRKFLRNVQDYGWLTAIGKAFAYILNTFFEHRVYSPLVVNFVYFMAKNFFRLYLSKLRNEKKFFKF